MPGESEEELLVEASVFFMMLSLIGTAESGVAPAPTSLNMAQMWRPGVPAMAQRVHELEAVLRGKVPSLNHHSTTTAPSQHHHCTITCPDAGFGESF